MARKVCNGLLLLGLLFAAAAAGCKPGDDKVPAAINHHLSSPRDLYRMRRVMFVALGDDTGHPRIAEDTSAALHKKIQAQRIFHVDMVWPDEPICRDLPIEKREALTVQELAQMRQDLRCDAILFGRVTNFMSYPRMQMGLYMRLLDLKDGRLVWAVDHTWDMTDSETEDRAKHFFKHHMRNLYEPANENFLLMSPGAFEQFVAWETARTMFVKQENLGLLRPLLARGRR